MPRVALKLGENSARGSILLIKTGLASYYTHTHTHKNTYIQINILYVNYEVALQLSANIIVN